MSSWNLKVNGKEYGPYSESEIRQFAKEGRILPDSELKLLPNGAWARAKAIKGLNFPTPRELKPDQVPAIEDASMQDVQELIERSSKSKARYSRPSGSAVYSVPQQDAKQRLPYGLSLLIGIVFLLAAGAIGLNGLLFLGVSTQAQSAPQQGAIGAQFGATFVGLYTLARCIEKLFKGLSGVV
jgi:hypothetical protein